MYFGTTNLLFGIVNIHVQATNNEQKPLVFIVFGAGEAEKETAMQK